MGRVGSGWVTKFSVLGGSGPMSKISNKYEIYMQEIRRLLLLMIRSCNIASFITVYLFIPFCYLVHFSAVW